MRGDAYGCLVCEEHAEELGQDNKYAKFAGDVSTVRSSNLIRHQHSSTHAANIKIASRILGCTEEEAGNDDDDCMAAPTVDDFKKLWGEMCKTSSVRGGISGVGGRGKLAKMRWVLREAMNRIEREFFRQPGCCMSVSRDESAGNLILRFRAVCDSLLSRRGLLGISRSCKTGSHGITAATKEIMKRRSAINYGSEAAEFIKSEYTSLRRQIEGVSVDAASDEVRSGIIMGGGINRETESALTPNLKVVMRDKLHGVRKLTWPHGYKGDDFMKNCFEKYVIGTGKTKQKQCVHEPG